MPSEYVSRRATLTMVVFFLFLVAVFHLSAQTYTPPTTEERWQAYLSANYTSPFAYIRSAIPATSDHIANDPTDWGRTSSGYLRRFGTRFAASSLQGSAEAAGSALLKHDNRYLPCTCKRVMPRVGYALVSRVVTRTYSGKPVIHVARIAGAYGSQFAVEPWRSGGYERWRAVRYGTSQIYFGALMNLLREFAPELRRVFKR
jgi:hypothetical protein